jgi:hypothetical protein
VSRIADGDCDALLELRDLFGELVYDRVLDMTGDRLVATFVTSGVLMRVWRRPAEFSGSDLAAALVSLAERRAYRWLNE